MILRIYFYPCRLFSMPLISPNFDVKSIIFSRFVPGAFFQSSLGWKKPYSIWTIKANDNQLIRAVSSASAGKGGVAVLRCRAIKCQIFPIEQGKCWGFRRMAENGFAPPPPPPREFCRHILSCRKLKAESFKTCLHSVRWGVSL